jgi:superfamily II DNA or RNA helicase
LSNQESGFLNEKRLLLGPWRAFERDTARLLIANGFDDVRIVGGTGDRGADVLGVSNGELWVFQCKHTTSGLPPRDAISEVVEAARYYSANRMVVATSRPPGDSFNDEKARYERIGLKIEVAHPGVLLQLMAATPEYSKWRKNLRDYQEEAADRFRQGLVDTGRSQIVLATGLGKTVVMAECVADLLRDGLVGEEGRVLVLAHTRELVDQLHQSFWYQLPKWVPTQHFAEGETPTYWDGVTFATVQSVRSRLESLPRFGLVLVDEAHHVGAEMFRQTIEGLAPKMLGGVTATPWRGDGYDIDEILGPPLFKMGIADGLKRGFLAEVDYKLLADNIDWNFVQEASTYRYSLSHLNRRLVLPTRDDEAARLIKAEFEREQRRGGIVYSPSIVHSYGFCATLRRYGLRAEAISSENSPRERYSLMTKFRSGQLDMLATVDLFNEGVDVPDVDLIVFMRATHSRRIFVQQLGRGLRITPTKKRVTVLDFVTDLRRIAEVLELDKAVRDGSVERLGLGGQLIQFSDASAGGFLREWMLDQASLILREGDAVLELPKFDFPPVPPPGGIQ